MRCRSCTAELAEGADFCSKCGARQGIWPPPVGLATQPEAKVKTWFTQLPVVSKLGLALVAFSLFGTCVMLASSGEPDPPDKKYAAFIICQDFVEGRLRAPGTAKFRDYFGSEVSVAATGPDSYKVVSSVDSENGFGALLRSAFSCEVTNDDHEDHWVLDDLNLVGS